MLNTVVPHGSARCAPRLVSGVVPVVLIVSKNVRANNLRELIAELRDNPGKYTFGGGVGSPSHVMGSWMNRLKGLNVTHIPYRGGAQAVSDVVGGHIDMFYAGVAETIGVRVELLTPAQVKELWPLCEVDGIVGAIRHPEDGYIQPADLTQALATSNNYYFARIGEKLGFERVAQYAKEFGLGERAASRIVTFLRSNGNSQSLDRKLIAHQ